jgi:hypothetical protein
MRHIVACCSFSITLTRVVFMLYVLVCMLKSILTYKRRVPRLQMDSFSISLSSKFAYDYYTKPSKL